MKTPAGLLPGPRPTAADVTRAAADFGHIVSARPATVLTPGTGRDLQEIVALAAARGLPVSARGGGYSLYGQAQAEGGVVVDMGALTAVHRVPGTRTLVAEAGASWREVVRVALAEGLAPPVLSDHLGSSVGGVLATGGLGTSSHRHGLVADTVRELDVVTGAGEALTCSRERHPALFDAVLAGLGQCALIVRATLALVPAPARVRRYRLYHRAPATFFADQRDLVHDGRFSHLGGRVRPALDGTWQYMTEAVAPHSGTPRCGQVPLDDEQLTGALGHDRDTAEIEDLSYGEYLRRLDRDELLLRASGEWDRPHPWLCLLLPETTAPSFVADVLADPDQHDLRTRGVVELRPLVAAALRAPLLRRPAGDLLYLFALMRTAPPGDPAAVQRSLAANRAVYERAREAGGSLLPVSALPLRPADWRAHFGPAWERLDRAKREFDPQRILTRGHGLWH